MSGGPAGPGGPLPPAGTPPAGPVGLPISTGPLDLLENQLFLAFSHLGRTLGVYVPQQLNRATFYRARLGAVVK